MSKPRGLRAAIKAAGGQEAFGNPPPMNGVPLPFKALNETIRTFIPKRYTVVGADSGIGKSVFGFQICEFSATCGHRALFVSLEMPEHEVWHRAILGRCRIDSYDFEGNGLDREQRSAFLKAQQELLELGENMLQVIDDPGVTPAALDCILAGAIEAGDPYELVVVDYLQYMHCGVDKPSREQEVAYISKAFNAMKKTRNTHVVALSQLTPPPGSKPNEPPQVSWLRESKQLKFDANTILLFWREDGVEAPDGSVEVSYKLPKNRSGRRTGGKLKFYPKYTRFKETNLPTQNRAALIA